MGLFNALFGGSTIASISEPGIVQIGENINITNGVISVPRADDQGTAGVVQAGSNVNISENGVISVQTATSRRTGVVKVGKGLTITDDGTISVVSQGANGSEVIENGITFKNGAADASTENFTFNGMVPFEVEPGNGITITFPSEDPVTIANISLKRANDSEPYLVIDENGIAIKGINKAITEKVNSSIFGYIGTSLIFDERDEKIVVARADDQGGAGIVQAGANITISSDGIISVPVAANRRPGVVKPGKGITIADDGTISVEKESTGWFTLIQGPDASKLTPDPKNGKNQKITIGSDLKVYDPYLNENTPELTLEITKLEETTVSINDKVALDPSTIGTYLIKWYFNGTYTCRLDPIKVHVVPARPF